MIQRMQTDEQRDWHARHFVAVARRHTYLLKRRTRENRSSKRRDLAECGKLSGHGKRGRRLIEVGRGAGSIGVVRQYLQTLVGLPTSRACPSGDKDHGLAGHLVTDCYSKFSRVSDQRRRGGRVSSCAQAATAAYS